jgi:hypothetical protein
MNWKENQLRFTNCPGECYNESWVNEPEDEINQYDPIEDKILAIDIGQPKMIRHVGLPVTKIRAKSNFAMDIAGANQTKRTWKEIIPTHYL